jgi:hypothetical protein
MCRSWTCCGGRSPAGLASTACAAKTRHPDRSRTRRPFPLPPAPGLRRQGRGRNFGVSTSGGARFDVAKVGPCSKPPTSA